MDIVEYLKEKIEPYFPFYTHNKDGIGVRVFKLKGQFLVLYEDKKGNKKNLKVSYNVSEEDMNLLRYVTTKIEEEEENSDFEQKKIIQVSTEIPGEEDE